MPLSRGYGLPSAPGVQLIAEKLPNRGRRAFGGHSRILGYSFLGILAVAAGALVTATLRQPLPPAHIDTRIESGRHLTFVLIAQEVAPGTDPYAPYVALVTAARDSLRSLASREGIYYSTVGVVQQWDIAEGLRVLKAYGHFDEVTVGRGWFNTGRFRYKGWAVPGVLVFLEDIAVGQNSWTSSGLEEIARFEGSQRSMQEWAARGFSLDLDGLDSEEPGSSAATAASQESFVAPIPPVPVVVQPGKSSPAIWRLDSDVLASVGGAEADPLHRVVGVAITEDHVIVAEASTRSLRFYNHAGELKKTVGREGEGPGEYVGMTWMHRVRDEIHVFDRSSNRVDVYALDGSPVRSNVVRSGGELSLISVVGSFADRSLLAVGSANPMHVPNDPETRRLPLVLVRHDPEGRVAERLIDIVGPERYFEPRGRSGVQMMSRPFGRSTGVGVVDSVFVVMDNESYAISVYDRAGVRVETLEPDPLPLMTPVDQNDIEFVRAQLLAGAVSEANRLSGFRST